MKKKIIIGAVAGALVLGAFTASAYVGRNDNLAYAKQMEESDQSSEQESTEIFAETERSAAEAGEETVQSDSSKSAAEAELEYREESKKARLEELNRSSDGTLQETQEQTTTSETFAAADEQEQADGEPGEEVIERQREYVQRLEDKINASAAFRAEEKARKESEEASREAEEKARKESEEAASKKARKESREAASKEAEKKARKESEEADKEAKQKARKESQESAEEQKEPEREIYTPNRSSNNSSTSGTYRTEEGTFTVVNVPLSSQLIDYIIETSEQYKVDPGIVFSVIYRESSFNTRALSAKGSKGLMQVNPRYNTARLNRLNITDLYDPEQNIRTGIDYLSEDVKTYNGDYTKVLTTYRYGNPNASTDYAERVLSSVETFRSKQ